MKTLRHDSRCPGRNSNTNTDRHRYNSRFDIKVLRGVKMTVMALHSSKDILVTNVYRNIVPLDGHLCLCVCGRHGEAHSGVGANVAPDLLLSFSCLRLLGFPAVAARCHITVEAVWSCSYPLDILCCLPARCGNTQELQRADLRVGKCPFDAHKENIEYGSEQVAEWRRPTGDKSNLATFVSLLIIESAPNHTSWRHIGWINFIVITTDGFFLYAHSGKWLEYWSSIHCRRRECTLLWNFQAVSTSHITSHLMGKLPGAIFLGPKQGTPVPRWKHGAIPPLPQGLVFRHADPFMISC
jgi:hypothetical protein